ncbi:Spermidine/putrescine transport system permease protein PotB [bacterium HR39]|nr:Spermidine/putrescine transport system permease protein PotB [bacterium HR39]
MDDWRSAPAVFWATLLPGLAWLAVFFLAPLALVWLLSFGERAGPAEIVITWTLDNYREALEPLYLGLFWKSFWIAGLSTLICLLVAFPVALAVTFADTRTKPVLLMLVVLPFWTNLLVRTYAMIAVLRTNGYLNWTLEYLWLFAKTVAAPLGLGGLFGERFRPLEILYDDPAVIFGIVYVYLPFMVLPIYAALERLDRSLLEASLDLGASHLRTLWRVVVPLARPGIVAGVVLVFVPALGTFVISDLLGGPRSQLVGNVIERQFKAANNVPLGAALSFLLLYATFVALALWAWYEQRVRSRAAA